MVTFSELRQADPKLWQTAADDLLAASKQAERTAHNIHANGIKKLQDNWADHTGAQAQSTLTKVANRMVNTGVLARGATTALDTLQDSIEVAQRSLTSALEHARTSGVVVSADGSLNVMPNATNSEADKAKSAMPAIRSAIDDAVQAATEADQLCVHALNEVSVDPDSISVQDAQNRQATAVKDALHSIRDQLPDGQSEEAVRRWWNGLSPEQRSMFKKSVPVELSELRGIPQDVIDELDNRSGGYSPLQAVRWAKENESNRTFDTFKNNCANFVSRALSAAGLQQDSNPQPDGDADQWGKWGLSMVPGMQSSDNQNPSLLDRLQESEGYSRSWYNSDAQRRFFLSHGGSEVGPLDARPGDVIYFNYESPDNPEPAGTSHHAALVTAVLPNGEVLYTQHEPAATNLSSQGRLPMIEQNEGRQSVHIVRPRQTW